MANISIVTTTRDRAFCFNNLLKQWINRQTVPFTQWLVVNDSPNGQTDYEYEPYMETHYRRNRKEQLESICENWLAAIPRITGDVVVVAEDDDWFHPEFVGVLVKLLEDVELAGLQNDFYFNLRAKGFRRCHNLTHASLGASAFRRSLLPKVEEVAKRGNVFIDMALWEEVKDQKLVDNKASDKRALHVGFKGMPGVKGLGFGHGWEGLSTDVTMATLQKWIGVEDTRVYRNIHPSAWK